MTPLMFAVITINLALVMYTIGVWSERSARTLKPWHLAFFGAGVVFDTIGTTAMSGLAGGFRFNLHGATGLIALILMAIHAVWATVTLLRGRPNELQGFHKFSLFVWGFWLIPFVIGAALNSGLVKSA
jgi:uncharacterized repeat protein (TIGR03987 family)